MAEESARSSGRANWGTAAGVLKLQDGTVVPGQCVVPIPELPTPLPAVASLTNSAGFFRISLPAGNYTLSVSAGPGSSWCDGSGRVTVVPGQETLVTVTAH